jgi:phage tail-like protein
MMTAGVSGVVGAAGAAGGRRKDVSALPQDFFGSVSRVSGAVPAMLAEDPLFHELCDAFDELLAPMAAALDCFAAYLDPRLAPPDFLDWLDAVLGAGGESSWPIERRRAHVAEAVAAHRFRGTAEGLRRAAATAADVPLEQVTVEDPGGVTYSTRALGSFEAARETPSVVVRVRLLSAATNSDVSALVQDAVELVRPVHFQVRIEVVEP